MIGRLALFYVEGACTCLGSPAVRRGGATAGRNAHLREDGLPATGILTTGLDPAPKWVAPALLAAWPSLTAAVRSSVLLLTRASIAALHRQIVQRFEIAAA